MRAAYNDRYGPPEVVSIRTLPDPTPAPDEVLVRVQSAAVTAADSRLRGARFPRGFAVLARLGFGIRAPRRTVLGAAFSGIVEGIGAGAQGVALGDRVAGMAGAHLGAHAELIAVRADRVAHVPDTVTHDDAAGVLFGGSTAWHVLHRKACVPPGATVLVIGASGAVGSNVVQLAVRAGCIVTGVCSDRNADLVRGLGARDVIDYTQTNIRELNRRFDVVVDCAGVLGRNTGGRLLNPSGVLCLVAADLWQTVTAFGAVKAGVSPERREDFAQLLDLVAEGSLRVVVSEVLTLADIVRAHRLVDSGRKVGNVIVRPGEVSSSATASAEVQSA